MRPRQTLFFLLIIFLSVNTSAIAQKFYRGISIGTGSTFTKVTWRDPANQYNYLKSRYGHSYLLSIDLRFKLKERLSLQTGLEGIGRQYNVSYTRSESFSLGAIDRLGVTEWWGNILIPVLCIYNLPVKHNFSLCFPAGFEFGFIMSGKANYEVTEELHDLGESGSVSFEAGPGWLINLSTGFGFEKENRNHMICGLSFMVNLGFKEMMEGTYALYDYRAPNSGQLLEAADFMSRNTSLILKGTFLFPRMKKKEKQTNG